MFDIGWTEMTVIAIIVIIVIGPKDIPKVLRTLGRWMRKARAVAREFQNGLDEVLRESEMEDLKKTIESAAHFNPLQEAAKTIDPDGELAGALDTASGAADDHRLTDGHRPAGETPGKTQGAPGSEAESKAKSEAESDGTPKPSAPPPPKRSGDDSGPA